MTEAKICTTKNKNVMAYRMSYRHLNRVNEIREKYDLSKTEYHTIWNKIAILFDDFNISPYRVLDSVVAIVKFLGGKKED